MAKKVAVITGGASGIGRAIAEKFSGRGYAVIVGDLKFEESDINESGFASDVVCMKADLGSMTDCDRLIDTAYQSWGRVDVLCNNVGTRHLAPVCEMALETWDRVLQANLRSAFICSKLAFPHLRRSHGSIINIASRAGITAYPGGSAYCVSKAAMIMLTKVLALEGAPFGIRVNCICPAAIDVGHVSDPQLKEMARSIPIGRIGKPDEVAELAAYLTSDKADYMTGSIVSIDGGVSAKGS